MPVMDGAVPSDKYALPDNDIADPSVPGNHDTPPTAVPACRSPVSSTTHVPVASSGWVTIHAPFA